MAHSAQALCHDTLQFCQLILQPHPQYIYLTISEVGIQINQTSINWIQPKLWGVHCISSNTLPHKLLGIILKRKYLTFIIHKKIVKQFIRRYPQSWVQIKLWHAEQNPTSLHDSVLALKYTTIILAQ